MAYISQHATFDGGKYLWADAMYPGHNTVSMDIDRWSSLNEWSGPIDPPFLVTRFCVWESGCNIPMQQSIDEPASLCLWHQECIKSEKPQEMARDQAQFEAWMKTLVGPVPEPWSMAPEVLWPVTVGKREL